MTRILILNGHPAASSLSRSLAQAYAGAASEAGHEVRISHLHDLSFDSDFGYAGYTHSKPLEPALSNMLQDMAWCEHFVLTTPMWWGGLPAKLKGLVDWAFLPGQAFDTKKTSILGMPTPLWSGRSARVVFTSDTPGWFLRWVYRNALVWQLRGQILGFVGLKPARFTQLAPASHANAAKVAQWLAQVKQLGSKAA